jgi:hypothetical protein
MPIHHQQYRDPKLHQRAAGIGPNTTAVIDALFKRRNHPEQAIRAAMGVLGLERDHSKAALETACKQAIALDAISYKNIVHLLRAAQQARQDHSCERPAEQHENLRGCDAFDLDDFDSNRTRPAPPFSQNTTQESQVARSAVDRQEPAHAA